jgi:bifunctional UDP-N-acetylglucosamine pyrophosphorylase / glucosamine-1-phosphate N-acetyltransferase
MKTETVILAAGKGTRMKSDIPKVMHEINSRPMISHIVDAVLPISDSVNVVTGHGRTQVEKYLENNYEDLKFSFQSKQDGTGGAIRSAIPNIAANSDIVVICAGDTPLLKTETLKKALEFFSVSGSDLTVISTVLEDPGHYGRIVRKNGSEIKEIVEFLDANEATQKITEINSGIYIVERKLLVEAAFKIRNNNVKHEYYLTDIVKIAVRLNKKVSVYLEEDSISLMGINDSDQLVLAQEEFNKKI